MELEHVNENTIRLIILQEDLARRGVNFMEMMQSQGEIEDFFIKILDEFNEMDKFADSDMVSFQVMPHRKGIEVLITKVVHSPQSAHFLDRLRGLPEEVKNMLEMTEMLEEDEEDYDEDFEGPVHFALVASFNNFEEVITLAQSKVKLQVAKNSLYTLDGVYYLLAETYIDDDSDDDILFREDVANILEYATRDDMSGDVLVEHGRVLIENDALSVLRKNFKK